MKVLWAITLVASLIFVIQSIATFLGADSDAIDSDIDFDGGDSQVPDAIDGGHGMNLLTFRNFINFILGFGWTAILLKDSVKSKALLIVIAALVGIALVAIVMYLFKLLAKMQQSGTIDVYKQAVGCTGRVYLTIPGERRGEGKVQITINESVREYQALTDGDTIKTDTPIKVVEVINESTLLVEELNSLIV